jgi:ankyrin repeat protein
MSVPSTKVKVKGEELEYAARSGNTDEILRLWRENGATLDVEHKNGFDGLTPLHFAAYNCHGEACRALVSTCGANIDCRCTWGFTPLMNAAHYNSLQIVEVLLELGADITLQNDDKRAALEIAREEGYVEVVAILEAAERIPVIKSAYKV